MKMLLNDRTVTATKPALPEGVTEATFTDEKIKGFYLRVRPTSRTFIFQYQRDGVTRKMTLGEYPRLTANRARDVVQSKIAPVLAIGGDPLRQQQEARVQQETFGEAVAAYLKAKAGELRPRTLVEVERYLQDYSKPLHSRALADVTQREISDLLLTVKEAATANLLRAKLVTLFAWAMRSGKVQFNPAMNTDKRKQLKRDRELSGKELALIWNALPSEGDFGNIVKLLMLSGQRRNEIGGLRWSEIDLEKGMINLPAERTKNGLKHAIPISKAMRAIIDAQPHRKGNDFVFGRDHGGFSGWSAAKAQLDAKLPDAMPSWHLHDLRHAAVTGMAESEHDGGLGIAPHIVELVVNHQSGHRAGIAGLYNHANNIPERREALEKWGKHVMALVKGKKAAA